MLNKKGQNTAEYAILIALVVAVALAMQTYVKRGIQGRVHDEVVDMANGTAELTPTGQQPTQQYEPYYLDSTSTFATTKDTKTQTGTAKNPTIGVESSVEQAGEVRQTLSAPSN